MISLNERQPTEILDHYLKVLRRSNMSEQAVKNFLIGALETGYNDLSTLNVGEHRSFVMSHESSSKLARRVQYLMRSTDMKFLHRNFEGVIVISRIS